MDDANRIKEIIIENLNQSLYEVILDFSSDPIFCFNEEGQYMYVNHAFARPMSLDPSYIIGKKIWDIFPGQAGDMRFAAVKKVFETGIQEVIEVRVDTPERPLYFITTVTPVKKADKTVQYVICISKEITQRKNMEESILKARIEAENRNEEQNKLVKELYHKSITDGLTTLFNRQYMLEALESSIIASKASHKPLALMIMDLDFFKPVNDQYGHHIGDEVLIEISQIMKSTLPISGQLGRYGGEEFIAFLQDTTLDDAIIIAEKIRNAIEKNSYSQMSIPMTISIGVASYDGGDLKDLIRTADDLMYKAKEKGRNMTCWA